MVNLSNPTPSVCKKLNYCLDVEKPKNVVQRPLSVVEFCILPPLRHGIHLLIDLRFRCLRLENPSTSTRGAHVNLRALKLTSEYKVFTKWFILIWIDTWPSWSDDDYELTLSYLACSFSHYHMICPKTITLLKSSNIAMSKYW